MRETFASSLRDKDKGGGGFLDGDITLDLTLRIICFHSFFLGEVGEEGKGKGLGAEWLGLRGGEIAFVEGVGWFGARKGRTGVSLDGIWNRYMTGGEGIRRKVYFRDISIFLLTWNPSVASLFRDDSRITLHETTQG